MFAYPWGLADYRAAGLSLREHPLSFFRAQLERQGVVRAADPLRDVSIQVEVNGRHLATLGTNAAGEFSFGLAPGTAPSSDVLMSFSKTGFAPATRLTSARDAAARPLHIELLPRTGQGAISEDVRKLLEPAVTRVGTGPLVFVPYRLPADAALGRPGARHRPGHQR